MIVHEPTKVLPQQWQTNGVKAIIMQHTTHSTDQIPPRKDNWTLADEGYERVEKIDYYGNVYTAWVRKPKGVNLSAAWKQFSQDFRSQPTKDLKPGNGYRPNLEQIEWKETNPDG